MPFQYFILDVFTNRRFKGNPLAVVLGGDSLAPGEMQQIAREFNLSETTFVLKPSSTAAVRRIRIFTPALELPLAGHPVIGTWHLLTATGMVPTTEGSNVFLQELTAGILPVEITVDGGQVRNVRMTQAVPQYFEIVNVDRLAAALSLKTEDISETPPAQFVSTGSKQLMLPLRSKETLARIQPHSADLSRFLAEYDSHLVYAFAEDGGMRFARSFFSAGLLSFEDPATGSAAGGLGAYLWKHRGVAEPFEVRQGLEMGRDSIIQVEVSKDGSVVKVGGTAVIVAKGELL